MTVERCFSKDGIPMSNLPIAIPPEAAGVVTALSQMGYNAQSAIADLLDNSIQAGASHISVMFNLGEGWLAITDNGQGMTDQQICEAFVYGKRRDNGGLGKFGMGLKTAATSMGKVVTAFSNSNAEVSELSSAYTLDLDQIEKTNKWEIYQSDTDTIHTRAFSRWLNTLTKEGVDRITGTVVRIEKLRNLLDRDYADKQSKPYQKVCRAFEKELIEFLGLVFHRYLEKGLNIKVNGKAVEGSTVFADAKSLWHREYSQAGRMTEAVVNVSLLQTEGNTGVYYYREDRIIDFGQLRHGLRRDDGLVVIYSFDSEADCFLEANTQKSRIERVNLDSDWLNEIDTAVKDAKQALKEAEKPAAPIAPTEGAAEEEGVKGATDAPQVPSTPAGEDTPAVVGAASPEPTEHVASDSEPSDVPTSPTVTPIQLPEQPVDKSGGVAATSAVEPEVPVSAPSIAPAVAPVSAKRKLNELEKDELLELLRSIQSSHPELLSDYV